MSSIVNIQGVDYKVVDYREPLVGDTFMSLHGEQTCFMRTPISVEASKFRPILEPVE